MKIVGYLIFASFYYIYRLLCPIKPKKVFAIMTHDSSRDGNVGLMAEYLNDKKEGFTFHYLKKTDRNLAKNIHGLRGKMTFFIIKPYHLATSEYILMDNVFLPMAYLKFKKKVKVVQLWHGTGTIKKFGQDFNLGILKKLEKKANSRITHLIVNSGETKKQYAKAFGIEEGKVFIYGLPRTDIFFDQKKASERITDFYRQYPNLVDRKLILYAPTFRDNEKISITLDTARMSKQLPEDYVYMLRLHPSLELPSENSQFGKPDLEEEKNVISMSSYPDISTLLLVSDYLITDYSSVIFEYCLRNRPMIFFAYDLEQFSNFGRGFYQPYQEYVPGPVVRDTDEIIELLKKDQFNFEKIIAFKNKNYEFLDGKSAERLYLHIFSSSIKRN